MSSYSKIELVDQTSEFTPMLCQSSSVVTVKGSRAKRRWIGIVATLCCILLIGVGIAAIVALDLKKTSLHFHITSVDVYTSGPIAYANTDACFHSTSSYSNVQLQNVNCQLVVITYLGDELYVANAYVPSLPVVSGNAASNVHSTIRVDNVDFSVLNNQIYTSYQDGSVPQAVRAECTYDINVALLGAVPIMVPNNKQTLRIPIVSPSETQGGNGDNGQSTAASWIAWTKQLAQQVYDLNSAGGSKHILPIQHNFGEVAAFLPRKLKSVTVAVPDTCYRIGANAADTPAMYDVCVKGFTSQLITPDVSINTQATLTCVDTGTLGTCASNVQPVTQIRSALEVHNSLEIRADATNNGQRQPTFTEYVIGVTKTVTLTDVQPKSLPVVMTKDRQLETSNGRCMSVHNLFGQDGEVCLESNMVKIMMSNVSYVELSAYMPDMAGVGIGLQLEASNVFGHSGEAKMHGLLLDVGFDIGLFIEVDNHTIVDFNAHLKLGGDVLHALSFNWNSHLQQIFAPSLNYNEDLLIKYYRHDHVYNWKVYLSVDNQLLIDDNAPVPDHLNLMFNFFGVPVLIEGYVTSGSAILTNAVINIGGIPLANHENVYLRAGIVTAEPGAFHFEDIFLATDSMLIGVITSIGLQVTNPSDGGPPSLIFTVRDNSLLPISALDFAITPLVNMGALNINPIATRALPNITVAGWGIVFDYTMVNEFARKTMMRDVVDVKTGDMHSSTVVTTEPLRTWELPPNHWTTTEKSSKLAWHQCSKVAELQDSYNGYNSQTCTVKVCNRALALSACPQDTKSDDFTGCGCSGSPYYVIYDDMNGALIADTRDAYYECPNLVLNTLMSPHGCRNVTIQAGCLGSGSCSYTLFYTTAPEAMLVNEPTMAPTHHMPSPHPSAKPTTTAKPSRTPSFSPTTQAAPVVTVTASSSVTTSSPVDTTDSSIQSSFATHTCTALSLDTSDCTCGNNCLSQVASNRRMLRISEETTSYILTANVVVTISVIDNPGSSLVANLTVAAINAAVVNAISGSTAMTTDLITALQSVNSSAFAGSSFQGVQVVVEVQYPPSPAPTSSPRSSSNDNVALGIGLGIGLGVPVLAAVIFFFFCMVSSSRKTTSVVVQPAYQ